MKHNLGLITTDLKEDLRQKFSGVSKPNSKILEQRLWLLNRLHGLEVFWFGFFFFPARTLHYFSMYLL